MKEHNNPYALLPCPFCAGKPKIYFDRAEAWEIIACEECGAEIRENTRFEVIAAWNTRTPLTEQSQERDTAPLDEQAIRRKALTEAATICANLKEPDNEWGTNDLWNAALRDAGEDILALIDKTGEAG